MSLSADPVLSVEGLTTEITTGGGTIRPVSGVSFSLHAGETLCLVGESGSGKSMLAYSLMRVLPPRARISGGRVLLQGSDLTAASEHEMQRVRGHRIAMVPQDPMTAFDPLLTIGAQLVEAIRTQASVSKRVAEERTLQLLELVRLPEPRRIARSLGGELSGGMNQRALLAMALATDPVVLIADEPTTALDVTVQAQVLELLEEIQVAHGLAILLVTHDMGVASMVADRIAVMYAGRIVEEASTSEIFEQPRHPYTVGLIAAAQQAMSDEEGYPSVPGAPPNLLNLPAGCAFTPRCPHVRAECSTEVPKLRTFGSSHAACVLNDEERPWLKTMTTTSTPMVTRV